MTLTLGLRWDYFNSYVPAQTGGFAGEQDGYWEGVPVANDWIAPAHLRRGRQRPELEGLQPTARARVRPVRQRQNRAQGHARSLHGEARHRNRRDREPVQHLRRTPPSGTGPTGTAITCPIATSATSAHERRVRRDRQQQLRPEQPHRDDATRQACSRATGSATTTGTSPPKSSTSSPRVSRVTARLVSQHGRLLPVRVRPAVQQQGTGDRQHPRRARGLRRVLHHSPFRSEAAGRRRLSSVRALQPETEQVRPESEHRQARRRSSASSTARTTSSMSPSMPGSRTTSGSAAASTPAARFAIGASSSTARRNS